MSRRKHNARAAYARQSIERFFDLHGSGESSQISEIMQQIGFTATVSEAVLDPETYTYPQTDLSYEADITMSTESDKIAVVAHAAGEKITYRSTQHPLQQSFPEGVQCDEVTSVVGVTSDAVTAYEVAYLPENGVNMLYPNRPIVLLRYYPEHSYHFPSVVAHELVHVAQALMGARVAHEYLAVDDEVAAYAVQAHIGRHHMHNLSDNALDMAFMVDSWRRKHVGEQAYVSNHELRAEVRQSSTLRHLLD